MMFAQGIFGVITKPDWNDENQRYFLFHVSKFFLKIPMFLDAYVEGLKKK